MTNENGGGGTIVNDGLFGSKLTVEKRWEEEDGQMGTRIALKLFKRLKVKRLVGDSGRGVASVMEAIMISLVMKNAVMLVQCEQRRTVMVERLMVMGDG
jgi:uncharacterized protein YjhX (UPF0386 family)